MAHHTAVGDQLSYGRTLVHAGIEGLREGERAIFSRNPDHFLAESARAAIKSAVVGAGFGLLASSNVQSRRRRLAQAFACGTLAFCADFAWKNRELAFELMQHARKGIAKTRDQHWLESNPIDYA